MKITIARQCGSGGHEIAEALAEKLHLEIFDKKRFSYTRIVKAFPKLEKGKYKEYLSKMKKIYKK